MHIACSHPKIVGFTTKPIDSNVINLQLRAAITGKVNIKFLVRYEVPDCTEAVAKYRFKRIELNLCTEELFTF